MVTGHCPAHFYLCSQILCMNDQYNIALWLDHWLRDSAYFSEKGAAYTKLSILSLVLIILCTISWFLAKRLIVGAINKALLRTRVTWDDVLVEKRVFDKLAHIVPAIVINYGAPYVFGDFPEMIPTVVLITDIYIIAIVVWSVNSVLTSITKILGDTKAFRDKPLSSYSQLAKIIVYLIGGVLIFSLLLGQSPLAFLGAMGAATAIILLIFKDAILGFVASIQMSVYDMIRVGDWVSMPKYDADGDVIAINLTTVMVQNWDKTITTIPSYAFISDSFKNWRGMSESGGRRIKRSILIKISSVKFCDPDMVERFSKIELIQDFVQQRQTEIDRYNEEKKVNKSVLINGRHMTNVGVFRRYAQAYLAAHPKVNQEMTAMVRQLEPTEHGLPIEIYCFSADKAWVNYEGIQADIFDHLLAAIPAFDLQVFEDPSGADFSAFLSTAKKG